MEVESVNRKYIPSKTAKRYQILNQGRGIIIRKLKEEQTKIIPEEFSKPIVSKNAINPTYIKPSEARKKIDELLKNKDNSTIAKKEEKKVSTDVQSISMPKFTNFEEIKDFVQKKQKENSDKNKEILQKLKTEKTNESNDIIDNDEQEDIDDLVNGNIKKEQELINEDYLKSLEKRTIKRLFKMVSGFKPSKQMTSYEMRKHILEKYKEMPSSKKQLVYEASKLKD